MRVAKPITCVLGTILALSLALPVAEADEAVVIPIETAPIETTLTDTSQTSAGQDGGEQALADQTGADHVTPGQSDDAQDAAGQTGDGQPEETSEDTQAEAVPPTVSSADETDEVEDEDLTVGAAAQTAEPSVQYCGHVQRIGWQDYVADGKTAGTSGKALRVEAMRIRLANLPQGMTGGIRYRMHVQKLGWQDWVANDAVAGTSQRSLRVEALCVELTGAVAERYDVYYRVHAQRIGWMAWTKNGATAGTAGLSRRLEAIQVCLVPKGGAAPDATGQNSDKSFVGVKGVSVSAHVQRIGWMPAVGNGETAGTTGRSLRVEALRVSLAGLDVPGGIETKAHVQRVGWQNWVGSGAVSGTSGRSLRVEAFCMRLTGEAAEKYDLYYRLHVQSVGWMGWAKNGERAGSEGMAKRAEAIQVRLVAKGAAAPANDGATHAAFVAKPNLAYEVSSLTLGWGGEKAAGQTAGVTGQSKGAQMFTAQVSSSTGVALSSGISYKVHTRDGAWTSASDDGVAGTEGKPLDVLQMTLTGETSKYFDVCYRVHISSFGWLAWARNGASAGSLDLGKQIEAVQAVIVPKGATPSDGSVVSVYGCYVDKESQGQLLGSANARQKAFVNAAKATPTTPAGYCAQWVTNVGRNAGIGTFRGDARDMYAAYGKSSKLADLKVGMIVAVSSHPNTRLGRIYGHVAIYIGDGYVMDSIGRVRKMPLSQWMDYYGKTVPVKWGWLGNVALA